MSSMNAMDAIAAADAVQIRATSLGDLDYFTCSKDERRLWDAYSANSKLQEQQKQQEEQVRKLTYEFVNMRTWSIIKEKEACEWQEKHAQLQEKHAQLLAALAALAVEQ